MQNQNLEFQTASICLATFPDLFGETQLVMFVVSPEDPERLLMAKVESQFIPADKFLANVNHVLSVSIPEAVQLVKGDGLQAHVDGVTLGRLRARLQSELDSLVRLTSEPGVDETTKNEAGNLLALANAVAESSDLVTFNGKNATYIPERDAFHKRLSERMVTEYQQNTLKFLLATFPEATEAERREFYKIADVPFPEPVSVSEPLPPETDLKDLSGFPEQHFQDLEVARMRGESPAVDPDNN